MKYGQIYKLLNDNGVIDKALSMDNGNILNHKKIEVIDIINYLVDFEKNDMLLRCEYWRSEPHNIISSFVIAEYCKLMLEKTNKLVKAYEYAISVHGN